MANVTTRGAITAIVVLSVVVILIGAGVAYYLVRPQPALAPMATATPAVGADTAALMADGTVEAELNNDMIDAPAAAPVTDTTQTIPAGAAAYAGTRLAGNSAPLLDFTPADYEAAKNSGKLVVLYFYANWCPICREEFPVAEAAFNQLTSDQVIGFRVNFNDNETDAAEEALAREHGVAYQHTKVFVRNGQRLKKSPETWTQERYVSEITAALAN